MRAFALTPGFLGEMRVVWMPLAQLFPLSSVRELDTSSLATGLLLLVSLSRSFSIDAVGSVWRRISSLLLVELQESKYQTMHKLTVYHQQRNLRMNQCV